jgi:hypothetical protein
LTFFTIAMNGLSKAISSRLREYLANEISLGELHDWLAPIIWDVEESGDNEAASLAHEIELLLAEKNAGHLSDEQFREALRVLADHSDLPTGQHQQ